MDGIIDYLVERRGKWTRKANTQVLLKFSTTIMFPMAKMWVQFVYTRLAPIHNASNITTYRTVMHYSILQKYKIYVGY